MKIDILTLFPEMFVGPFSESIVNRAREKELVEINLHNLRHWATDKYGTVDDKPYSGGPGMVIRVDVVDRALHEINYRMLRAFGIPALQDKFDSLRSLYPWPKRPRFARMHEIKNQKSKVKMTNENSKIILLSPKGKDYNQQIAQKYSKLDHLILIAGHYEGVDERVAQYLIDEEISIGQYVLTGGEIPAMVVVDSVVRLLPGALGKEESLVGETHSKPGHKKHPVYTRPEVYKGWKVPEVLLSGDHKEIEKWKTNKP